MIKPTAALSFVCKIAVMFQSNVLWSFGWNKYGQLGTGDTKSRDSVAKMSLPWTKGRAKGRSIAMLRCGDWGTAIVTHS